jgi:CRP-like cAMP-binding protein
MAARSYFELLSKDEKRINVPAGHAVFEAGQPGTEMYILTAGSIELRVKDRTLERVEPGGVFGEMALIDAEPRSASALAVTDCELVPIDTKRFEFMLGRMPFFATEVMRVMARRLRQNLASAG